MQSPLNFRSLASSISIATVTVGWILAQQVTHKAVAQTVEITGVGFIADTRLYITPATSFGVSLNYQEIGTESGIEAFRAGSIDFVATDLPVEAQEGEVLVPTAALSVDLVYRVPIAGRLNLSRNSYCGIFTGAITNWNDPQIATDNPGAILPNLPITVVYPSVSTSSTFLFTNHLNTACASTPYPWTAEVANTVSFPVGIRSGPVLQTVALTQGAIAYAESPLELSNTQEIAALVNQAGNSVIPTRASIAAAISGNLSNLIPDPDRSDAYPIVGLTFILVRNEYESAEKSDAIKAFFTRILTEGDDITRDLTYSPLPQDREDAAISAINSTQQ